MKGIRKRLKRKALRNIAGIKDAVNAFIHPFQEMPSISSTGAESPDRINEHDLFSLYTADIIRKEIVFVR